MLFPTAFWEPRQPHRRSRADMIRTAERPAYGMKLRKKNKNGDNCHVACDHYHRYKEDIALMKELGLKSYRFSVSWPRVISQDGKVNPKGLEFYSNLVDELIKNGIEPLVTLYHWDLPLWQYKKGGWLKKIL